MGIIAGKWPVLARLPDVAADAPTRGQSPKILAHADAHDYRFDPPQARSLHHPHDGDHPPRVIRRESPILPRTDPFAIPSPGVMEKFGPIVRLVLLIALFTAAGVILLAGGNDQQPSVREKTSAETTVTKQSLEPTAVFAEASAATSTAAGPALVPDSSEVETTQAAVDLSDVVDDAAPGAVQASGGAAEAAGHPYPQTAWPSAALPDAGHGALPQVQTTDPPQAVAHLPGHITEIPQRHASHDDNQPGLH